MKKLTFSLLLGFLTICSVTTAQVAINTDGISANSKAMLDISSSTMGLLIPRMTTTERTNYEATLGATEKGMTVFDTDLNHFFYYDGSDFVKISAGVISLLEDADGDTKIEVEKTVDDDFIYFSTRDTNFFKMSSGRLEVLNTGQSVFIGENAGASDDLSYNGNVFIGYNSGTLNTTAYGNTAIGSQTFSSNVDGSSNSAVGIVALKFNSSGHHNSAFARGTLYSNTSGSFNTAVGSNSLYNNTSGDSNTALGYRSLYNNNTGHLNVGIGREALYRNTYIDDLVAVGNSALYWNGYGASGTQGHYNTAIGSRSMYSNKLGYSNTSLGYETLYSNTEGANNTAIGYEAIYSNTGGSNNTALGYQTLYDNNYGTNNTAIGYQSMFLNDGGNNNTANGMMALYSNVSGHYNTASGSKALYTNNGGGHNVAFGHEALYTNTSGSENTALGKASLYFNVAGSSNTAVGYNALQHATGNDNIAFGANAGDNITTGTNNIIIGKDLDAPSATASDQMYLGGILYGDLSTGNIGIGTISPGGKFHIKSTSSVLSIIETTNGDADLHIKATGTNDPGVSFYDNGTYGGSVGYSTGGDYMFMYDGGTLAFKDGELGIGITTPSEKLHVYKSSGDVKAIIQSASGDADLHIKATGTNNATVAYYNDLSFKGSVGYAPSGDYMFIYKGGNIAFKNGRIGVGTLDPQCAIQTSGDIRPTTNQTQNLGSYALPWDYIYANIHYVMPSKSFSTLNISSDILKHPLTDEIQDDIDLEPGTGSDKLEIISLPSAVTIDNGISLGDMAVYNYKANYEQQVQIEELKKLVEQLILENRSLQDKIKMVEESISTK